MAIWTPKEDKILIEIYATAPREEILHKFPNRVWKSIYKRSVILGLSRPKNDAWKKEDDECLRKLYPNTQQELLMAQFPGRTWKSITWRAINVLRLCRTKEIIQEKTKQTNRAHRGVEYPSQSAEVQNLIKKKVQEKYGVDNVFQSEIIKKRIKTTNLEKYGVENPNQNTEIHSKGIAANQKLYRVDNPFQMADRVQQGMQDKYGETCPLRVPEIKAQQQATNIERYGFPTPCQNPIINKKLREKLNTDEVKEKRFKTFKKKGNFSSSDEEDNLYGIIQKIYPDVEHHKLHPLSKSIIDYYFPSQDLWGQYDGGYWHGRQKPDYEGPQRENIKRTIIRDKFQNETIPNLIRFLSEDVKIAIKNNNVNDYIKEIIEDKLEEIKEQPPVCHQFIKKTQYYNEDVNQLPFNPEAIKAIDFNLNLESLSDEIVAFIERYEWLGTIGVSPKWCFTARLKGFLGGVVLINEPTAYSKILGDETPKYEALIQRGASVSWAPKNLGSRLIMYSCRWMVNNTDKKAFIGYADINANEKGIIYRACNFDYLGSDFGVSELLKHPLIPRLFTSHYLKRTSAFMRWCRENNVTTEKTWFKENKFKNLETIPPEIKRAWYDWIQKIISESEKIKIDKKMKYVLILGRNKKETKDLKNIRKYIPKPYPQDIKKDSNLPQNLQFGLGKTQSRRNNAKDQFIIDNYGKMTNLEMAKTLGEAPRWIKRCISLLSKQNKISLIRPNKPKEDLLNEEKWIPEIRNKAISLRMDLLKNNVTICYILKTEFDFEICPSTLTFWFGKFNCPFPTKEEWLERFITPEIVKNLLNKKYLRKDIVNYIKDTYQVYISEDIVNLYIRSLNLF